jgi:hypothetical protein
LYDSVAREFFKGFVMVVFDLRVEAHFMSWMYLIGPGAVLLSLMAMAPSSLRARLPLWISAILRPVALSFAFVAALMVWFEYKERQEANALVEQCLNKGCTVAQGLVSDVQPVHQVSIGSRLTSPRYAGYFRVGDAFFAHSPHDFYNYSPVNHLQNGDMARVYSLGYKLILVEKLQP